jgi:hypothetical protein
MVDLIMAHGLDDGATALIGGRQLIEMAFEVAFDLSLGLRNEPKAGAIPQYRGQGSDAE